AIVAGMTERESDLLRFTDARLSAMGRYLELFTRHEPEPLGTPTLLVQASEPLHAAPVEQIAAGGRGAPGPPPPTAGPAAGRPLHDAGGPRGQDRRGGPVLAGRPRLTRTRARPRCADGPSLGRQGQSADSPCIAMVVSGFQ